MDFVLEAMADRSFDGAAALEELTATMRGARLSMPTTISVFRDLFLAGGLRQGYPVALGLAEAAAGLTRKPAGIADLLRLLSEFSVEIPPRDRPRLPASLAALASSQASTKARAEARVLGARLAGVPLETYVATLSGSVGSSTPSERRGLWKEARRSSLAQARLPHVDARLATKLLDPSLLVQAESELTGVSDGEPAPEHVALGPGVALCAPDLLVAAVVRSVIPVGLRRVRTPFANLSDGPSWTRCDVGILALAEWARGTVDHTRYWDFALAARTAEQFLRDLPARRPQWWDADYQRHHQRLHHGQRAVAFDGRGRLGAHTGLVLTSALDPPASRLEFLRALEVLLLANDNPVVLSTPTWADGTLDLDTLLQRLRAAAGLPLGPLDLVQALHRLRPCDPSRTRDVEELAASGGSWRTAPRLTVPDGSSSLDALELVRTWIVGGGLPSLDPYRTAEGEWATDAVVPVPWSTCVAAPRELREGRWSVAREGDPVSTARAFPLWPDRTVPRWGWLRQSWMTPYPTEMSGRFGLPLHEALLSLLVRGIEHKDAAALDSGCRAVRRGNVDTDLFVDAVAATADEGALKVGRLAQATQQVFEQGGLAQFWDAALAATDALAARPGPVVRGLGQLADVLTAYAHEVPDPQVPAGLRAVAERGGTSKFQQSVASLVGALEQGGSR